MPPEVLARKLVYLRQLLADLEAFRGASLEQVREDHYKLERLFELLVATSTDILFHELSERDIAPDSYRDAFRKAAEIKLIPDDLSERLQAAAGMRNILVHLYEQIDYAILRDSIEPALADFNQFAALFEARLMHGD